MCGICGEVSFADGACRRTSRAGPCHDPRLAHRGRMARACGTRREPRRTPQAGHHRPERRAARSPWPAPTAATSSPTTGRSCNFRDVRADLEARGERFATKSDTEVLLRAMAVWGRDALSRLNGMWAFALGDRRRSALRFAETVWASGGAVLVPHSGRRCFRIGDLTLLDHPDVSRDINPRALAEQVACRYVLAPRSLLTSVKKLPPGHILHVDSEGASVSPY